MNFLSVNKYPQTPTTLYTKTPTDNKVVCGECWTTTLHAHAHPPWPVHGGCVMIGHIHNVSITEQFLCIIYAFILLILFLYCNSFDTPNVEFYIHHGVS